MDIQQHDDETIIAARILIATLASNSPLENPLEAEEWAAAYDPVAASIASQQTEEERREVSL